MRSLNFEMLRPRHPELADLGGFAETYARPDPGSAVVKLRIFVEQVVGLIYAGYGLPRPFSDNLNDMLNEVAFRSAVPDVVLNKLHILRKAGNRAAHREAPTTGGRGPGSRSRAMTCSPALAPGRRSPRGARTGRGSISATT